VGDKPDYYDKNILPRPKPRAVGESPSKRQKQEPPPVPTEPPAADVTPPAVERPAVHSPSSTQTPSDDELFTMMRVEILSQQNDTNGLEDEIEAFFKK